MSQSKLLQYFEEELAYLASAGPRFAKRHPDRAALVSLDNVTSRDPDVERLVQAFAFLAGQIRAELHNELPEITHSLINLLWPHYLRSVPSTTIIELRPDFNHWQRPIHIAANKGLFESTPITSPETGRDFTCRFRNAYDVDLYPIRVAAVDVVRQPTRSELLLRLEVSPGADASIEWNTLRFHLAGDPALGLEARHWLLDRVNREAITAEIESKEGKKHRAIIGPFRSVGLQASESLLDQERLSFPGYRLVQEYFLARHKFLFVDLQGLDRLMPVSSGSKITVRIPLLDHPPERIRFNTETIRLHCTPAINLFRSAAVPIRYDSTKAEYELIADHDRQAVSIQRVMGVYGQISGSTNVREYTHFLDFKVPADSNDPYYQISIEPGVDRIPQWKIMLARPKDVVPPQILSIDLECSNGDLASALLPGDIRFRGEGIPDLIQLRNLTQPEPIYHPPIESASLWRFISHMAMNYLSLEDENALVGILKLYDWTPNHSHWRRLQGIRSFRADPGCTIVEGIPLRGRELTLELDPTHFANVGDAYLFSEIMSHFFALYANINSYTRLKTKLTTGLTYSWPALNGKQRPI